MMKRRKKIILWLGGIAILGVVLLVVSCNLIVAWDSNGKTYDSVSQIPHNRVGLLLATSPITPGGAHNFYFRFSSVRLNRLRNKLLANYLKSSGNELATVRISAFCVAMLSNNSFICKYRDFFQKYELSVAVL